MIRLSAIGATLGFALLLATPALAVTVTNLDGKDHVLTADRGVQEDQHKIAAGASAQIACPERCEFRVQGMGYGRTAESGDKLVIAKGGMIQFQSEAKPDKSADAK